MNLSTRSLLPNHLTRTNESREWLPDRTQIPPPPPTPIPPPMPRHGISLTPSIVMCARCKSIIVFHKCTYKKFLQRTWNIDEWSKNYATKGLTAWLEGDQNWIVDARSKAKATFESDSKGLSDKVLSTVVWVCTLLHSHTKACTEHNHTNACPDDAPSQLASEASVTQPSCSVPSSMPSSANTMHQKDLSGHHGGSTDPSSELKPLPSTSRATRGPLARDYADEIRTFGHMQGVLVHQWKDENIEMWFSRKYPHLPALTKAEMCTLWPQLIPLLSPLSSHAP